jgi:hypothetical protein
LSKTGSGSVLLITTRASYGRVLPPANIFRRTPLFVTASLKEDYVFSGGIPFVCKKWDQGSARPCFFAAAEMTEPEVIFHTQNLRAFTQWLLLWTQTHDFRNSTQTM